MTDKVTNINKELEDKLFDTHMNTMFNLVEELLNREELTEIEEKFVDALIELNEFWDEQENANSGTIDR